MTYQEASKIAQAKLTSVPVNVLKEAAIKLNDNMRDEADFALDQALILLGDKMDTESYVAFCNSL